MARKTSLLIIFFLSLVAGFALLHRGFFPSHDGEYHVIRFYEFDKTLRSGQWYPRWQPDLNYGYGSPLLNYYYPLPNYLSSFIHLFGFSFIESFKIEMLVGVFLGSLFMYLWVEEIFGISAGFVASVFYTFSPYHFLDIYIRGSVGEVLALAFFPGFLFTITKAIKGSKKFYYISSCFLALTIFSHNILGYTFFIFGLVYSIFITFLYKKDKLDNFKFLTETFVFGLGLSAVFWLPALLERSYVRGLEIFDYSTNFADLYQLIIPSWGSGFSGGSLQDQMSFQIGIANLLVVLIAVLFFLRKERKEMKLIIGFFLFCFFSVSFLMLKNSIFIWKTIPLFNYFQFPWRFLSLSTLASSFLAGALFSSILFKEHKLLRRIMIIVLPTTAFLLGIGYMQPAHYFNRDDSYYTSKPNFMDGTNTPGNALNTIWFNAEKIRKTKKLEEMSGNAVFSLEKNSSVDYLFKLNVKERSYFRANIAYFPGWTVKIDRIQTQINPDENGLFSFYVPTGQHDVRIKFSDTVVRKIAYIVSLITILFLLKSLFFVKIKR